MRIVLAGQGEESGDRLLPGKCLELNEGRHAAVDAGLDRRASIGQPKQPEAPSLANEHQVRQGLLGSLASVRSPRPAPP